MNEDKELIMLKSATQLLILLCILVMSSVMQL